MFEYHKRFYKECCNLIWDKDINHYELYIDKKIKFLKKRYKLKSWIQEYIKQSSLNG